MRAHNYGSGVAVIHSGGCRGIAFLELAALAAAARSWREPADLRVR